MAVPKREGPVLDNLASADHDEKGHKGLWGDRLVMMLKSFGSSVSKEMLTLSSPAALTDVLLACWLP